MFVGFELSAALGEETKDPKKSIPRAVLATIGVVAVFYLITQYTLAIDRADESVAHLYDPLHPAVLRLIADTIAECNAQGKGISVCGEMAGDPAMTRLLLGLGLRSFSMHPTQILVVKQEVLRADTTKLRVWAQKVLESDEPASALSR